MSDCCSCHINPPCDYCTSRSECARCLEIFPQECMYEDKDGNLICEACDKIILDKQKELEGDEQI